MTQQTTPRKSGEAAAMVAKECAIKLFPPGSENAGEHWAMPIILRAINQAVADAVKGSGAVEALELLDLCFKRSALSNRQHGMCIIGDDEFEAWTAAKKAYDSLRALTLPEQPNK